MKKVNKKKRKRILAEQKMWLIFTKWKKAKEVGGCSMSSCTSWVMNNY